MIDTVALRSKTLMLAMSGRLSEQKVDDGNAIPKEEVVSDSSKDETAYDIPASWRWVRVKDVVAKDVGGGTPSKAIPEYWDNGEIPWATVKDFSNSENGYIKETVDHITKKGLDNSSANMVDEHAIVVCMRMALGKIVRVSKPMAINQDLRALWLKPFVEQDYFVYFYKTLKVEGRGTTVAGIKKEELMNYAFPVPPIKEQRQIIEKVNKIFAQLDIIDFLQSQYSSDLEVLKLKIIDAGIQGKLTEQLSEDGTAEELLKQITEEKKLLIKEKKIKVSKELPEIIEDEIPFAIPDNWKWIRLGDLIQIKSGDGLIKTDMVDGDIPVYGGNGISGYHNKCNVNKRTVVIGRVGVNCGSVHITEKRAWVTDNAFITSYPEKYIDQNYLSICLKYLELGKRQTATAQPVISGAKVYPVLFPVPPLAEQRRIAIRIMELLSVICEESI